MPEPEQGNMRRKFRILVAPLDWGLGHATRLVPVIRELIARDCEPLLAGEGMQEQLLRGEFPDLQFLSLEGYRVRYSKKAWFFSYKILSQVPAILSSISREHRWLKRMARIHGIDGVISDNRFGLYHSKIPCIFITHQLKIRVSGAKWLENLLRKLNYRYINKFTECWVPDVEEGSGLAGELAHPEIKPRTKLKYIGPLSRLEVTGDKEVAGHVLFILSGPEPQRTMLENRIVDQVSHYPGTATVVRGLPASLSIIPSSGMIRFYNHLGSKELGEEMSRAEWVIGRSGYSTVMDLAKLGKKAILIPTPGQTEQEYLAKYLEEKGLAVAMSQKEFSLEKALQKAKEFDYRMAAMDGDEMLKEAVGSFIERLAPKSRQGSDRVS